MMRAVMLMLVLAASVSAQSDGEARRIYDTAPRPLSALTEWTETHPDDGNGWYFRGLTESQCRLLSEASRSFDRAAKLLEDDIRPRTADAALHLRQGRLEAALADYDEAIRLDRNADWVKERRRRSAESEDDLENHRNRAIRTISVLSIVAVIGFVVLWRRTGPVESRGTRSS